jgi:hypothetical protein
MSALQRIEEEDDSHLCGRCEEGGGERGARCEM